MSEPVVVAQAGHKTLRALQQVLLSESIETEILCPPDSDANR